jgi:hypothetical protein
MVHGPMTSPRCGHDVSPKELIRAAAREGWSAVLRPGGHWQLIHPEASEAVIFAATPSDHRWWLNTLAKMRRVLPPAPAPKPARPAEPRPKRRPKPAHRPAPVHSWPERIAMFTTPPAPQPERRPVPPLEPRRPRLAGGPAGFRSCLNRV